MTHLLEFSAKLLSCTMCFSKKYSRRLSGLRVMDFGAEAINVNFLVKIYINFHAMGDVA